MGRNRELACQIKKLDLTQAELARLMNIAVEKLTGRYGTYSERTVYALLNGESTRPHAKTLAALEAVFGCPPQHLGFASRPGVNQHPPEPDVKRRRLLADTTGTVLATTPAARGRRTVGTTDAERIRSALHSLHDCDQASGGTSTAEAYALEQARKALHLVDTGSASTRVRDLLFAVAADAVATAAWAAVDGHRGTDARRHLEQAMTLAAMSGDGQAQFWVWNSLSMLASQQGKKTEALAAAQAMRGTAAVRKDPLFCSLAHARIAVAHAKLGDRTSATRSLDHARTALDRTPTQPRHPWITFYDAAELDGLTGVCMLEIGRADKGEYHVHRALAQIRPALVRNRALYTVNLATAQLRQGEIEQAIDTVQGVEDITKSVHGSARLRTMIGDFQRDLVSHAPTATVTRDYLSRHRKGSFNDRADTAPLHHQ